MHWSGMNWPDINHQLHAGKIQCEHPDSKDNWPWAVLTGEVWKKHGKAVADATPYLPGSFDRPPRNPAEKISSGYKAWEWLLYMVGMGPALLHGILPDEHWAHYCKGVSVIRTFQQNKLPREQIIQAHKHAISYVSDFEDIYCQRMPERIHFVRQSVHTMAHLGPEAIRIGPQTCYTQWPMERTIGNLGEEIKQPSNPYANLSERGLLRCQLNALKAMIPDLNFGDNDKPKFPRGSKNLGNGFVLLRARDEWPHKILGAQALAIRKFLDAEDVPGELTVKRWARLRLPNGQIARSGWKERQKDLDKVRMARNVKVWVNGQIEIAEVEFYFCKKDGSVFALASLYSRPDEELLRKSYNTVWSCTAPTELTVIRVTSIVSVVAMVPHIHNGKFAFFLVEKPGLAMLIMAGYEEPDDQEVEED
ncbi:hypothetical protein DFH06DRAFT_1368080 [Mycena polygramma]|nr:hypothetical protein DFH06DRAFT_1368080 [Mycena polygramma]